MMQIRCPRCGYTWERKKGRLMTITCPNCHYTFRLGKIGKSESEGALIMLFTVPDDLKNVPVEKIFQLYGIPAQVVKRNGREDRARTPKGGEIALLDVPNEYAEKVNELMNRMQDPKFWDEVREKLKKSS